MFEETNNNGAAEQNQQETNGQNNGQQAQETKPEKTYTQAELDAREASARKAAEDRARKALLKEFGFDKPEDIKTILEAKKTADAEAEAAKDLATKYADLQKAAGTHETALQTAQGEIAKMKAENELLQRQNALGEHGVFGKEAKAFAIVLAEDVTDEKDFSAVAKEYFAANPRNAGGKPKPPDMPGGNMGTGGGSGNEASDLKAQFEAAKKTRDYVRQTTLQRLANEKGISLFE
jgi:hypothetical protein